VIFRKFSSRWIAYGLFRRGAVLKVATLGVVAFGNQVLSKQNTPAFWKAGVEVNSA
jgi:hypothetical protein